MSTRDDEGTKGLNEVFFLMKTPTGRTLRTSGEGGGGSEEGRGEPDNIYVTPDLSYVRNIRDKYCTDTGNETIKTRKLDARRT